MRFSNIVLANLCSHYNDKFKQCACIIFSMKLSKFAIKTLKILCQVFGESSLGWTQILLGWYFKANWVSVQSDQHSDQTNTCKMPGNVGKMVHSSMWTIAKQSTLCTGVMVEILLFFRLSLGTFQYHFIQRGMPVLWEFNSK